jgi:hypothetical protein
MDKNSSSSIPLKISPLEEKAWLKTYRPPTAVQKLVAGMLLGLRLNFPYSVRKIYF